MRDCFQAFRLSNDAFFTLFGDDDDGGGGGGDVVVVIAAAAAAFSSLVRMLKSLSTKGI